MNLWGAHSKQVGNKDKHTYLKRLRRCLRREDSIWAYERSKAPSWLDRQYARSYAGMQNWSWPMNSPYPRCKWMPHPSASSAVHRTQHAVQPPALNLPTAYHSHPIQSIGSNQFHLHPATTNDSPSFPPNIFMLCQNVRGKYSSLEIKHPKKNPNILIIRALSEAI